MPSRHRMLVAVLLLAAVTVTAACGRAVATAPSPSSTLPPTTTTTTTTTATTLPPTTITTAPPTTTTTVPPTTTTTSTTTTTTTLPPSTTTTKPASVTHLILMGENFVNPGVLVIKAGDTVKWTNTGFVDHDAISGADPVADGVWASTGLAPGESWSMTFDTPGTYGYFCSIHPYLMPGTILVEG